MTLDPKKYPRTASYLATLPAGLQSYPTCVCRADIYAATRTDYPEMGSETDLSSELRYYLKGINAAEWIPEVLGNALLLAIRDLHFLSNDAFLHWVFTLNDRLFDTPLYRAAFHIFSPQLLLMGATKRWSAYHHGTVLTPSPAITVQGRVYCKAQFTFPPRLYDELLLENLGQAYLAAVTAANAKEPRLAIEDVSEVSGRFVVSWLP